MQSAEARVPFDTEKIVGAWVDFWNSYEFSRLEELFVIDSSLTCLCSEKEGVMRGFEAVKEHHRGFGFVEGGKKSENKLWVEDLHTTQLDSAVIVAGIWFFQRASGRTMRGPFTSVYVWRSNDYRLVHQHVANYPDSRR